MRTLRILKLYEELFKNNLEIDLGLELEWFARHSELKSFTFQDFLDKFDIKPGEVDGKEMGKALMDQMKYRKLTDEEFDKFYNEYKNK